ncbi:MAG: hypothetical protein V4692_11170, partial [Bdellovibrionota bacterium]
RRAYTKDSVEVLMFDELSNGLLANLKEGADPRMTRTIQNCQVVRQDLEPTSGIKTYTLSKEFQMRFPLIGADMQTEEGLRTVQNDSWNDQTIHRIELSNNNEHTIAYRIPARPGNSVQIQVARGVLSAGGWPYDSYYVTKSASFTPITTVSGASEMIQHGDDIYFRMDPHSTATIRISVSAIGFCISASNLETRSKIGGFFLGFENPFSLHQVRDWNGGSLVEQISREWIDVAPFKVGIISPGQKVLPMWQAFDGRLKYDAAGSKPSADQMVAAPHEEAMCSRN